MCPKHYDPYVDIFPDILWTFDIHKCHNMGISFKLWIP